MLLVVAGPAALAQAPPASSPAVASSAAEWVVFVSSRSGDGDLYAVRPDGTGLRMVLGTEAAEGTVRYDPARTRLVYHRFSDSGAMLMSGSRALFEDPNGDVAPAWSTRGEVVYVAERDGRADLFVADSLGGSVRRLTSDPEVERYPAWSPDGSRIAFDTFRGGQTEIVVLDLEGMDVTDLRRRGGAGKLGRVDRRYDHLGVDSPHVGPGSRWWPRLRAGSGSPAGRAVSRILLSGGELRSLAAA
jgi:TolB protein